MADKQIIIDGVPVQDCVFFYTDIQEEIICDLYPTCGGCKGTDCYYKQHKRDEQKLAKIKKLLEPIKCKHPEDCWENKPDWNGEVYGCEPDDMDNIASCPSKVATSVLQIIEGKDNGI